MEEPRELQVEGPPDFSRAPIFEAVPRTVAVPPLGPELRHLLTVALHALRDEDAALARAFVQAPGPLAGFHAGDNQGLAYWVTEATLVYTIFKAWLPLVPVETEVRYPEGPCRKADMVVYDEPRPGARPRWVFEAKWWERMDGKACAAIDADVQKLRGWAPCEGRYLLTFWYSYLELWRREREEALAYVRRELGGQEAGVGPTEEVYVGAFPTKLRPCADAGGGYFALSVLRVAG